MERDTGWIASAKYFEHEGENVSVIVTKTNGGTCSVPMSNGNSEYQDILAWVANGNTIQDAD